MKYFLLLLLTATAMLSACRKDSEDWRCVSEPLFDFKNECKSLPELVPTDRITPITALGDEYSLPSYSLLNPDLIALVRDVSHLVVYNKASKEMEYESPDMGFITGKPGWSENNVICFPNLQASLIHFLDMNSGQITSVTFEGAIDVEWLNESEIVFFQNAGAYRWQYMKYNYYTGKSDTLIANARKLIGGSYPYNKRFGKFLLQEHIDFSYWDMNTNTEHEGAYAKQEDDVRQLIWHPFKNRVYYLYRKGLYYYDYDRQEEKRVKKNCDSWGYDSFDISPDGGQIVAELHQKWIDKAPEGYRYKELKERWYYINTHVVTFDLDGCNEEVVLEGVDAK